MRFMTHGGQRWGIPPRGFLDRQIAEQAKHHDVGERVARQFIMALHEGGCTDAEAYAIMRDRFCAPLGTGCELWDTADVPDRWFRNAWVRSHNGGPIDISLERAKPIQFERIKIAAAADVATLDREPAKIDWTQVRREIKAATSLCVLRRVWPLTQ